MDEQNLHADIQRVTQEINRCNQRGGRMLSLIDLIEAETISLDLAAVLSARIYQGASFLIGALPGGAGKTTVMGALLACAPAGCQLIPTDTNADLSNVPVPVPEAPRCYICHEIGAGHYYAYLWGQEARLFFALPQIGHQIAANLHADTYEECRSQLCLENQVPLEDFATVDILVFLRMKYKRNSIHRAIETVWERDADHTHQPLYTTGASLPSSILDGPSVSLARRIIDSLLKQGRRRIEEFRRGWILGHLKNESNT